MKVKGKQPYPGFELGSLSWFPKKITIMLHVIGGDRRDEFLTFPRVLTHTETQTASSRIRTWLAKFIFYDNKHYTQVTYKVYIK